MRKLFWTFIALLACQIGLAQTADSTNKRITVRGKVTDTQGRARSDLLIINQRISAGTFGNADGTFSVYAHKEDTLIFGAFGYRSVKVCFRDSLPRDEYEIKLKLKPLQISLAQAQVFAPRDLEDIQKDIDQLGFKESDYRTSGVDALQSPITFLYEQFSKRERSRRLAIQLDNDERRRELLKELFGKYVDFDIIDLPPEEFDAFVDFINVGDAFLQNLSQYEFILFVKKRYQDYRVLYHQQPLQPGDFEYHEDDTAPRDTLNRGN